MARQRLPRDENGNIIRPEGETTGPREGEIWSDEALASLANQHPDAPAITKVTNNVALTGAYLDVLGGKRPPTGPAEVAELFGVSEKLRARSLREYQRLQVSVGNRIEAARLDAYRHQENGNMILMLYSDPGALSTASSTVSYSTVADDVQPETPKSDGE